MAGATERSGSRRPALASALLAVALAAGAAAPATRAEAQTASPRQAQLDATVRFLQEDQGMDGGFGGEAGAPSDPGVTSWVALALAAVDVNPHSQARPGGTDAYAYLAAHAGALSVTTDFERALLVVDASESPPRPLGGVDLVAKLLERRLPSGAFTHEAGSAVPGMNDTIFAILALSPIKEAAIEGVVQAAAEWVIAEQDADGSWPSWCPRSVCGRDGKDPQDNTDMTGAAIQALNAAGLPGTAAQARALAYLHEVQLPDGGWPQARGERESNVGSTAWVVQGIWAAGENPEAWRTGAGGATEEPLDYLTSLQQPDGHARYQGSRDLNGVWMTAYVTPALAGRPLPIVPPPLLPPPTPGATEAGAGGATGKGDEGVIAGGGGEGAADFSRPRAGSNGRTPGGARVVRGQGLRAPNHSAHRRGANRHQARGTATVEPRRAAEADQEVGAVSAGPPPTSNAAASSGSPALGNRPATSRREADGRPGARGGPGVKGTPAVVADAPPGGASAGERVSGVVIGSPAGAEGKPAFGAPGLRGAGGGAGGDGAALAIGAAALVAALLGVGWEGRRGARAIAPGRRASTEPVR